MKVISKIANFCSKYMWLLTIVIVAVALVTPGWLKRLAGCAVLTKANFTFLGSQVSLKMSMVNIFLVIIMFGMGCTLSGRDFVLIAKRPLDVVCGILGQYIVMPLGAFLVGLLCFKTGLIQDTNIIVSLMLGLVILGSVPGGTASNVLTFLAKGDVPLSVTVTMCTTLLSPLMTPLMVKLLVGQTVPVDFWLMFFNILEVVLVPILLGLLVHTIVGDKIIEKFKPFLVMASSLAIVMVVGMCVAPNRDTILNRNPNITVTVWMLILVAVAVLLHHLLGLFGGYWASKLARLPQRKVNTLSIEVGIQNSGLSVTLTSSLFAALYPLAVLPCIFATVIHQIVGPIVASYFASKIDRLETAGQENSAS